MTDAPLPRFFSIGETSELSGVKPYVLRYWEQELGILRPSRGQGGRRQYSHDDVILVRRVRELIYEKGLTISAVRRVLDSTPLDTASNERSPTVQVVSIGEVLAQQIFKDPQLISRLAPEQFEELICERLYAMGFEPRQVGATNRKDGGIDVVFWPRARPSFPFLGAAQIKHHRSPSVKEGPATVRDFAGAMAGHPFHAGMIVTNTAFTPDAKWFAREHAKLLKLRDLSDIRRWLLNDFNSDLEWREIPDSVELCPGVRIKIR